MKKASIADLKAHFSAYLKGCKDRPVVVTRNGRPVGVLLAVQDEDEIERLILAYTPRLRAILDAANRRIEAGQGIEHDPLWREQDTEPAETPKAKRTRAKKRVSR
jgi:prevent-host-death family protein